jgi:hypothetical protein
MINQSSQFTSLDAHEKAATEGALVRCRSIAERILQELVTSKPEHFSPESLAEFYASLEQAAEVLGQEHR